MGFVAGPDCGLKLMALTLRFEATDKYRSGGLLKKILNLFLNLAICNVKTMDVTFFHPERQKISIIVQWGRVSTIY